MLVKWHLLTPIYIKNIPKMEIACLLKKAKKRNSVPKIIKWLLFKTGSIYIFIKYFFNKIEIINYKYKKS